MLLVLVGDGTLLLVFSIVTMEALMLMVVLVVGVCDGVLVGGGGAVVMVLVLVSVFIGGDGIRLSMVVVVDICDGGGNTWYLW